MEDERLSEDFHAISKACLATLEALPRTGVYAHADHSREG
jgi:hypothetical protein